MSAIYDIETYLSDIPSVQAKCESEVGVAKNLRLKAARAARDLTQQDLARAAGVTRQTINAIEQGDYNPTISLCIRICRTLAVTLDDIFWEEPT